MKTLISLLALSLSTVALADGFKCEQREHAVNLQVYNKTQATAGTRNVAVMILSDATVAHGRKTIASFTADKSTVRSTGGTSYVAKVDLRVSESNRSGENVLGTKLGQIKEIRVNVAHSYASTTCLLYTSP